MRRNVKINDRRTSVMLELALWDALHEICERRGSSVHDVCAQVQAGLAPGQSFTSALRVYIIDYYRTAETVRPASRNAASRAA